MRTSCIIDVSSCINSPSNRKVALVIYSNPSGLRNFRGNVAWKDHIQARMHNPRFQIMSEPPSGMSAIDIESYTFQVGTGIPRPDWTKRTCEKFQDFVRVAAVPKDTQNHAGQIFVRTAIDALYVFSTSVCDSHSRSHMNVEFIRIYSLMILGIGLN